jgi:hypothetical protein
VSGEGLQKLFFAIELVGFFCQLVFHDEYPGWSFEPGSIQALSGDFTKGGGAGIHSGRWIMEAPKSI